MKNLIFLSCLFFFACVPNEPSASKNENSEASSINTTESKFDPELAERLGADDYGMKMYVMAHLKRGPNRDRSEEEAAQLQRAHMDNIGRLAEEGKLVLAGPFGGDGDLRGIYIFNVSSIEEAKKLTESDPAIQAGSLEMELFQWYGSAALGLVNEWHSKVAKKEI